MLGAERGEQAHVVVLGVRTEPVALGGLLHDGVVLVDDLGRVGRVLLEGDALGLALLQAGADRALTRLGHGRQDRVLGLAGGVDDDGAVVRDGLQRHHQVGVLVDGVQAHEGDGLVALVDFCEQVGAQRGLPLGGGLLDPRGSPLGPQVVHAAHRVLVEGDEGDLGVVLAPRVASPHAMTLRLLEGLPHAGLFDGKGAVLEAGDSGGLVFLRDGHK